MIKSRPNVRVPSQSNPVPTCPVPPERGKTGQPRSISPAAIRSSDLPWCLRVFVGKKSVLRDRMNSTEAVPSPVPVPVLNVPVPPFESPPRRSCPVQSRPDFVLFPVRGDLERARTQTNRLQNAQSTRRVAVLTPERQPATRTGVGRVAQFGAAPRRAQPLFYPVPY